MVELWWSCGGVVNPGPTCHIAMAMVAEAIWHGRMQMSPGSCNGWRLLVSKQVTGGIGLHHAVITNLTLQTLFPNCEAIHSRAVSFGNSTAQT